MSIEVQFNFSLVCGGGKGTAVFISIVKHLNDQSSSVLSQAASSQASSAREPLNFPTFLASRSAILSELAWLNPLKIIKRMPARAKRSFSKSSSMAPSLPHSHSATKGASINRRSPSCSYLSQVMS